MVLKHVSSPCGILILANYLCSCDYQRKYILLCQLPSECCTSLPKDTSLWLLPSKEEAPETRPACKDASRAKFKQGDTVCVHCVYIPVCVR